MAVLWPPSLPLCKPSLGMKQVMRNKSDLNSIKCSVVDHNPDMPSPTAAEPLDGELILLLAHLA